MPFCEASAFGVGIIEKIKSAVNSSAVIRLSNLNLQEIIVS